MPENEKENKNQKNDSPFRALWRGSLVGVHMVATTFVGLAIGYYLDKFFDTRPWLTLIFLFIGIGAGFKELFKYAKFGGNRENKKK